MGTVKTIKFTNEELELIERALGYWDWRLAHIGCASDDAARVLTRALYDKFKQELAK